MAKRAAVHIERRHGIAFLIIDNPPVNALSLDLRRALIESMSALSFDAAMKAIVLVGGNGTFVSGSDLREFDRPPAEPTLPDVIASIEDCPKPVIAAIDGAALGGGYELALACDFRIAVAEAVIGLPEGMFGIIPGAGGTVRAARLTDAATVLEIVSSCRRVKAPEAQQLGLIDQIVGNLRSETENFAKALGPCKRRLRDMPAKFVDPAAFEQAAEGALRRGRGRPHGHEQVAALKRALSRPFDEVLDEDRAVFQRLRQSDESAALRHLFFAERAAARIEGLAGVKPRPIASIGIVGAGTMGASIAAAFLAAGMPITLADFKPGALDAARVRIDCFLARAAKPAALATTTELADLAGCDLVLEAVFEDMDVKRDLLRRLDQLLPAETIIASNTSYLDLDVIAAVMSRPDRVVGLHFFAPAHVMKLLEVVRGANTAPEVLATALKLGRMLGKVAVGSRVGEGFIGNRIYSAYRSQCETMLLDGALPEEIDAAIEALGFAMGPFSVSDLSGLDIAWAHRNRKQAETGDRSDLPVLEWLVEAGRLGRKSGSGWYRYENGQKLVDPALAILIGKARAERQVTARSLSRKEIQDRAMAAIVNEALLVLEDGIAARASDVDLVLVLGYGFPRHLGGPLRWARMHTRAELEANLDRVAGGRRRGDLTRLD